MTSEAPGRRDPRVRTVVKEPRGGSVTSHPLHKQTCYTRPTSFPQILFVFLMILFMNSSSGMQIPSEPRIV